MTQNRTTRFWALWFITAALLVLLWCGALGITAFWSVFASLILLGLAALGIWRRSPFATLLPAAGIYLLWQLPLALPLLPAHVVLASALLLAGGLRCLQKATAERRARTQRLAQTQYWEPTQPYYGVTGALSPAYILQQRKELL